jgi:GT2 family glycosyltransferase
MTDSEPRPLIDVPLIDGPLIDVPLIDVIVPVHGAGPVFRRCAASVIAHAGASDTAFKLVIVLDGPPDVESLAAVEELRAAARREREGGGFELSVLTHETPLGFLRSANRAMRESTRDVVLLNSDTQVTAGWLGRLRAAAYSDAKIATVTPFSNNATICSLPRFLDENAIPADYTIDSFGALVTRVSRREYPRLPTGVGFCLYVKRSVLDEIGLFDEVFGLGYGEEVDLCFRAARCGYVHVLDDATFVFHEGGRSFGRRRERRMLRGERMMRERYPEYVTEISDFIKKDPIAPARTRVLDELRRSGAGWAEGAEGARPLPKKIEALSQGERVSTPARSTRAPGAPVWVRGPLQRVLHLVPGWPPWTSGDAAMAVRGLIREQCTRREVFVYTRMTDPDRADGSALEYLDGGVRVRLIVADGAPDGARRTMLSRIGVRPDPVGEDFARFLDEIRPQVVHAHDLAGESFDLLASARGRAIRTALKSVDAFVMGSQSLADSYAAARLLPSSARVAVSAFPLNGDRETHEEIERVYAEVMRRS